MNTTIRSSDLLRFALRLDGVASFAMGVLACAWPAGLASWIGTTATPVLAAGLFLLAYGLTVFWLGARATLPRWAAWTVIAGNALWTLESLLLTQTNWIAPGALGLTLLLGQAAAVAGFAVLQFHGLKRSVATRSTTQPA